LYFIAADWTRAEEDEEVIDRSQSLGLQFNAAGMPLR
jgi:hypothetical protein